MGVERPTLFITGVSGNLGLRLLPQLEDFNLVGFDLRPPSRPLARFIAMDLAQEASCRELYHCLCEFRPVAVVHLAFVIDPVRTGILDEDLMWQVNVAGAARVMEAISEANRNSAQTVTRFVFPSSVSAYGPDLPGRVNEDFPLAAHTLPYAIHKKESDEVVQQRAASLRDCQTFILRPHIFAGASVENYLLGAFRGTPNGISPLADRLRRQGKRLPCMLPRGQRYLDNLIQFVHVDDMARLIAHAVRRIPPAQPLTVLNVAGRGEPLTFRRCIEIAGAKLVRVPGQWAMRQVLQFLWDRKISAIPPQALPYMTGQYVMDTARLRKFLGPDYDAVMRYSIEEAFADSFPAPVELAAAG